MNDFMMKSGDFFALCGILFMWLMLVGLVIGGICLIGNFIKEKWKQ